MKSEKQIESITKIDVSAVEPLFRKVVKYVYHANALEYFCPFLLIAVAAFYICYGIMDSVEPKQTAGEKDPSTFLLK